MAADHAFNSGARVFQGRSERSGTNHLASLSDGEKHLRADQPAAQLGEALPWRAS
jgi:hypothetical protein